MQTNLECSYRLSVKTNDFTHPVGRLGCTLHDGFVDEATDYRFHIDIPYPSRKRRRTQRREQLTDELIREAARHEWNPIPIQQQGFVRIGFQ